MNLFAVSVVALGFLVFSLVSRQVAGSFLTGPLLFTAFGLIVGPFGVNAVPIDISHNALRLLAEFTLVLVLFSDAANTDLAQLRRDHNLPVRMLLIGLPLSIVLGAVAAAVFFANLSIWEAALLAAILAPTDAALGQVVVTSPRVPIRIRQALNLESGLNDGMALPLVLIFASLAAVGQAAAVAEVLWFGVLQVTIGPLVGLIVGYVGAKAVVGAYQKRWMKEEAEGVVALAMAVLAFSLAGLLGGNGFMAAFIGGLTFGNMLAHKCKFLYEFAEAEGLFLILMTFFIFGGAMLPEAVEGLRLAYVGFALLSLTLLRLLPVWLSLIGTGLRTPTTGFLGWFGPRGLASVLFVLLILEESQVNERDTIFSVVMVTVALSIVLHGLTAGPGARWYGKKVSQMGECEEMKEVAAEPFGESKVTSFGGNK